MAVADLARYQLIDVSVVPGFRPSPQAYAPAVEAYGLMQEELRGLGITSGEDADLFTALIGGRSPSSSPTIRVASGGVA